MAAVVSTPVKTWVATLQAGILTSAGISLTVSVHLTQGWEIQVPIGVRYSSAVSLATLVNVYPSNDGGLTFDTVPIQTFTIAAVASARQVQSIRLTTGQYIVTLTSSSPVPSFFVLSQEVITAVANN